MSKLSQKDKNLLIILAGILIVAAVYYFGYIKLLNATDELERKNSSLQTSISNLEKLKDDQAFYEQEIKRLEAENIEIENLYPSAIMSSDKVLFAKKLEDKYDLYISYVGMSDAENVSVAYPQADQVAVTGEAVAVEENPNGIYMYRHGIDITFETGYRDLKRAVKYIVEDSKPKSIQSLTLSYNDSTGLLSGSMSTSMYSMTGTSVVYTRPDFTGIKIGTDDIFGTFEGYLNDEVED